MRTIRTELKIDAARQRDPAYYPVLSLGFRTRTGPSKPLLGKARADKETRDKSTNRHQKLIDYTRSIYAYKAVFK